MVLEKQKAEEMTLEQFLNEFKLHKEFESTFGMDIHQWNSAPDLDSYEVIELLLDKHRSETDYVIIRTLGVKEDGGVFSEDILDAVILVTL